MTDHTSVRVGAFVKATPKSKGRAFMLDPGSERGQGGGRVSLWSPCPLPLPHPREIEPGALILSITIAPDAVLSVE